MSCISTCFKVLWGYRKGRPGKDYRWSNDQPLDPMCLFPPGALDGVHLRRIASMLSDQHIEAQGFLVGGIFALASCIHLEGWHFCVWLMPESRRICMAKGDLGLLVAAFSLALLCKRTCVLRQSTEDFSCANGLILHRDI